jgi:hypothetical protein
MQIDLRKYMIFLGGDYITIQGITFKERDSTVHLTAPLKIEPL